MAKKLKIGVIGLGTIGPVHCDAYQANAAEADLYAACDIDTGRLAERGDKFKIPHRYTDYRDLLKSDVDAVSICVGNTLHRDFAVAAFQAGKHVLVEKPMAMNAKEAADIVAAAKKARKALQVGMVWRQGGEQQVVRKLVADGVLGTVYQMRAVLIRRRGIPGLGGWFTTKALSGGGPLIDCGVHWFDLAMHLSGQWKPTHVSAMCYAKFGPKMRDYKYTGMWAGPPNYKGVFNVEDFAAGFVRFGTQASMSFEISWAGNSQEQAFVELLGDKAGVRVCEGKTTLLTEYEGHVADITPQYADPGNRFHIQARKFLAACRGEGAPAATGEEGLTVMKLIDGVYASSKAGKEIALSV